MKYANTQKAFVPTGLRESVPPFGVTRDYTDEEVQKSPELRYALEREYLVPFDPAKHALPKLEKASASRIVNPAWVTAPDNEGGERKTIRTREGVNVEYIVADTEGVDGISNPGAEDVISSLDGQKPVDFIEQGVSAHSGEWKTASDHFEDELKQESDAELEYNDDDNIADGEDQIPAIPDVDDDDLRRDLNKDYSGDYSTVISKTTGNMGATETNTRTAVTDAAKAGMALLNEATKANADDGEVSDAGVPADVADFLAQTFATKKWVLSKETNKDFLTLVSAATKSENVKSLADQRLTELA